MNLNCFITASLLLFFTIPTTLSAMNDNTQEAFEKALKASNEGDWRGAAKQYKRAIFHANSHTVKANALKKEAEAYRNAELYYKEFKCLKTLVANAPEQINYKDTIEREYEIANRFFKGYRETPYTWMPWIKDDNHAQEIYETAQQQSPYAKFMPDLLVKLSALYLKDGENNKAEKTYKEIIEKYPNLGVAKTAYLDLAYLYLQLAKRGDGDGHNTTEARSILQDFVKKYPNAPEVPWSINAIKETYELGAERLYVLAEYYNNRNNPTTAKRYIRDILVNYPETKSVAKAEKMLKSIDMPLYPTLYADKNDSSEKEKEEKSKYITKKLPEVAKQILVIPANSENKWLRPVVEEPILHDKKIRTEYEHKI